MSSTPKRSPLEETAILRIYERARRYARHTARPQFADDFAAWMVDRRLRHIGTFQRLSYSWIDFCRQELGSSANKAEGDLLSRWWDRHYPNDHSHDSDEQESEIDDAYSQMLNHPEPEPDRKRLLEQLRSQLPEKYTWLFDAYIFEGLTLKEAGRRNHFSESRASQIWKEITAYLAKLRDK